MSAMAEHSEKQKDPGKPLVFLLLAAIFVGLAILGYVYEDELYIHRPYRDITFHTVNVYFIGILIFSLIGAFFCLFAYLNPRVGNKILGRGEARPESIREKAGTVTYNVFHDTTTSSVKARHRARKAARHARHKYAKATPKPGAKKSQEKSKK